jgi:Na+-transporting methylmalonyl-CoA/oxaloacetate decarboxylase gamma subunit
VDIADALVITALGISVVFCGLILTALLISSLSFIPALLKSRNSKPVATPVMTAAPAPEPAIAPEIIAVLTAVLETEIRLHRAYGSSRFTFRRSPTSPCPPGQEKPPIPANRRG